MSQNLQNRNIQLVGYPTNKASSGGYCALTPYAFRRVIQPYFANKFGVAESFEIIKVKDKESDKKNGINNFDSVYQSVQNHALKLSEKLWKNIVPITIGGDHSQGFSTIKASIFVEILKQITSEDFKFLDNNEKQKIISLISFNKFLETSEYLEKLISQNQNLKQQIENIIDKIHVIWVDAHGDFNTLQTTDSANFHGMALSAACGLDCGGIEKVLGSNIKAKTNNIHLMCTRDLDENEESLLKKYNVDFERFEMSSAQKSKIRAKGQSKRKHPRTFDIVFNELVAEIKKQKGKIILSIDIDHLSVPETGTPLGSHEHVRKNRFNESPTGPSLNDTYNALMFLAHDADFISFDLSEVALGFKDLSGKFKFGITASLAGINILASLIGGDEAQKYIFKELKKAGSLKKKLQEVAAQFI